MARFLIRPFMRWAEKLRHPTLFWLTAALFAIDVVLPDVIPLADEILLGLATLIFANWKSRLEPPVPRGRR